MVPTTTFGSPITMTVAERDRQGWTQEILFVNEEGAFNLAMKERLKLEYFIVIHLTSTSQS